MDYPIVILAVSLIALCLSTLAGARLSKRAGGLGEEDRADLNITLTAALTLLALIIGFAFSMAITRYNQRKDYEAVEASTIGTELARAELMPAADAARVRGLLKKYLNLRISFYLTEDTRQLQQIDASTAAVEKELWSAVRDRDSAEPAPIAALILSGMNEMLNAHGYTQAAWWNRIPTPAWILMVTIAVCCHGLIGYTARRRERIPTRLFVLPVLVSITLFLIADIANPTDGMIRVHPHDLESLAQSVALQ
jgi:hypothetical protein